MRFSFSSFRLVLILTIVCISSIGCSTTRSTQQSSTPERQEIQFSTRGSDLKTISEFLDIHTETPISPSETGTKRR
ncbi:MAG: hypothetical protein AAF571_13430 [Verrucomicrobiota bacterium]